MREAAACVCVCVCAREWRWVSGSWCVRVMVTPPLCVCLQAVQVSECYYELHLRADMYTSRHTQWFYFAVSNTRKDITYR